MNVKNVKKIEIYGKSPDTVIMTTIEELRDLASGAWIAGERDDDYNSIIRGCIVPDVKLDITYPPRPWDARLENCDEISK